MRSAALCAALLLCLPFPSTAQTDSIPGLRDVGVARSLSFLVPGGGHAYAEDLNTTLMLGAAAGSYGWATYIIGQQVQRCGGISACPRQAAVGAFTASIVLASWIYGMMDADNAIERYNARVRAQFEVDKKTRLRYRPYSTLEGSQWKLGVSLVAR